MNKIVITNSRYNLSESELLDELCVQGMMILREHIFDDVLDENTVTKAETSALKASRFEDSTTRSQMF
ncbi:unnamed protein product [Caenorhabditis angaria]|uniref:Uncharacterized protein n=1 Tax=Caenorhabditis angaria TaxID=860376 RepID=A0A9P1N467_9PELO|nr:unnamed protein product [Caenorhabditis angaria]